MAAAVGSIASVVSAVLEVGKCLAAPIGQFKYLYNYNNNLKSLETEVMRLKKTRDEAQGKVDAAEINGEEIKQSVKEWQTKVNNTITEAERLIEEKEENRRCFKGLRPNCINSYKHSKKASKLMVDHIGPLLQQEERFDEVSYSSIQQSNYETNFDKIRDDVLKLKNARLKVGRKVEEAEIKGEEIEADVKKWLQDVDSIIAKAEELIENQSSIGTDHKIRYQNSKAASELMVDHIGPLLQQEERFDEVSYSTTLLSNYETNFDKLRDEVLKLKNARLKVERKVEDAKIKGEEIEEDVKKWLEDVDSIIAKAEELIENQSSIGTDRKTRYQNSKAASELMVDHIGPLLQQEERFDEVSYSTALLSNYETNFDKIRDDVLKLKNARLKVGRKVEEAEIKGEEIEADVKKWLQDVDSIIAKAEELIENQSSIGTDHKIRYQNSKAASELMVDHIGPLLQQEERFDEVSYSTTLLSNYETNFDKLRDDVLKLKNARLKVERKVEEAKNNVEEIEEDVKKWLEDVDSIIVKAQELIENQSSIGTDRKTRYQNSKAASELMVDHIGPLLQQEKSFKKVSHPTILKEIWLRSNEDYLAFESRNSTVKDVWDALKDENIYMIGVYGMGGLGKTTLVQEVGRQAEKDKLFEEIVFVEVTETLDVKKVQTEIADKLRLKFDYESERASKLYERLNSGKKILLILDNIWEDLDLKTIGIPSKRDRGGCKLLLTTRNLDVLQKMDSTNNFGMGILNEEEAWNLFQKMAGNVIQTPELNSLPNAVCKECGGLPIVICTIAKALRNKRQESQWEDALRVLRVPSPTKFPRVLEREYYKIKLSYDYLEDDELKKTFIISSLMRNNTSLSDLLKNIFSLGILEGANLTIEQARNRLDLVVKELKDSCLLLDGSTEERFSMHDVVRIIAITCGYIDHHVFTERNDIESEWRDKDKLRKCTIISLVGNNIITQLWNEGLYCPKLEFFYMSNKDSSFGIPGEFFTVMPKLKVLNLFEIQQSSLPSSLDLLTNLQTLCLDYSNIKDVAIIEKLKKLKVLSLRNTDIEELPTEMGQLTQLRLLDVSNCGQLEVIAPNVISKLSHLEELYMKGCCIQWKVEELKELKHLSQLTSLEIDIEDNTKLPEDFFFKELRRCKITIGDWSRYARIDFELLWSFDWRNYECSRMLEFKYDSSISLEELRIFKNVELLRLAEFSDDDNNLTPLFNKKVIFSNLMALELKVTSSRKIWDIQPPTFMSSLTRLNLHGCRNIKYAFPFSTAKSLSTLQDLQISNCKVLEEIVADEGAKTIVNFAFPQVTSLKLENLPKLTVFYHRRDIWELPMLERLVVTACEKFTSKYLSFQENSLHISESNSFCLEHKINFHLEEFDLQHKWRMIKWQSRSKTLEIINDYKFANTPLGLLQKFENLEVLQLKACRYKEIFSCGNDEKQMQITLGSSLASFQYLKVLRVGSCYRLKKFITPSTARSLVQLREMSIENCEMLIEIVENVGEGDETTSTEIVFDNLKKLSLRCLESLICFCSGNYSFNFPSLEELIIGECPDMKTFSQGILSTPKLHKVNYESRNNKFIRKWENKMEVKNEGNDLNKAIQGAYKNQDISLDVKLWTFKDINSTEISYNQHPNSFYQNLTHLILSGCENIKYAFPSSIAKSLHQLQYLRIHNCKVLEEVVSKEGTDEDDKFVFPHVISLKLQYLPKFTAFYHTFEWPMLRELVVKFCGKFMTSKYLSFQENNEGELHFSEQKSLFLNDKINSDLERLELHNAIKMIRWQSQSKVLEINYDKLASIGLGILHRFENLKELKLYLCKYKEIFSCGKEEKHTGRPTHQQIKSLSDLPNLEVLNVHSCNRLMSLVTSPASLQNLEVLGVSMCKGLMKLMTPSMARSLVQLREIRISRCKMLIEIVENEGEGATTTTTEIVFNNLKKLSLEGLESLTFFCSRNYSITFPSLEELIIKDCPNMKTFSGGILSTPKLHKIDYERKEKDLENKGSELNTTIQQAHKTKVDSNLTALRLSERDIIRIWQGQLPKNSGKVKTLQLIKDESTNIPIQILQNFSRLEELKLQGSSYEEIFSCNEDEEHVKTLTKLKVLKLLGLFNLKYIWKQNSRLNSILQNLYHLKVQYCHNLTTLLPSSSSFENLSTLKVKYCNGFRNLLSSSTARSLVRLVELEVEECEMMIEVLANEGDIEKGTIVFEKLEYLSMGYLESLTCFCSGSYTLKFPNLERLDIYQCSKMKIFSEGDLSMPRLQELNGKDCLESDLDTITQQLQNDCSKF